MAGATSLPLLNTAGQRTGVPEVPVSDLKTWLAERGEPAHRVRQLRRWILAAGAESFDAMTDLPLRLRQELSEAFVPLASRVVRHLAAGDGTHKLLVALADGKLIECVLIQEAD